MSSSKRYRVDYFFFVKIAYPCSIFIFLSTLIHSVRRNCTELIMIGAMIYMQSIFATVFQLITQQKHLKYTQSYSEFDSMLIVCSLDFLFSRVLLKRKSFMGQVAKLMERLSRSHQFFKMSAKRLTKCLLEGFSVTPNESKCQCCVGTTLDGSQKKFSLMKHCFLRGCRYKLGNWRWKLCRRVRLDDDFSTNDWWTFIITLVMSIFYRWVKCCLNVFSRMEERTIWSGWRKEEETLGGLWIV